jgi:hypothetical protein
VFSQESAEIIKKKGDALRSRGAKVTNSEELEVEWGKVRGTAGRRGIEEQNLWEMASLNPTIIAHLY